jgi:hypothetical protein
MAIRFDAAGDRVYLAATLPAPAAGVTILGWWQMRVDRDAFSVYYRTSGAGGTPTIHSVSTYNTGVSVNVFTTAGELNFNSFDAVNVWLGVAVVDTGSGVTLYAKPFGQDTMVVSGAVGSGTPGHFCIGGRSASDATEWFNGNAAHVRVFADALTQSEVEAEWASPTPVLTPWADYPFVSDIQDASGNARHLTVVSGTPAFEPGPFLGSPDEPPRVAVGTTPVLLTPGAVGSPGRRVLIRNANASPGDTLSLGGTSSVTAGDGFLLAGGAQLTLLLTPGDEIWAVRGGSTDVAVHVLRLGPQ